MHIVAFGLLCCFLSVSGFLGFFACDIKIINKLHDFILLIAVNSLNK